MADVNLQLSVVSPNHQIPYQSITYEKEWKVIDLKRYLNKVYPGQPPVESQRLIFAGRLISDDLCLHEIFGQEPFSRTLHLVLGADITQKAVNELKANVDSTRLPNNNQSGELHRKYLLYLQDYYRGLGDHNQAGQCNWQYEYMRQLSPMQTNYISPPTEEAPPVPEPPNMTEVRQRNFFQRIAFYIGGNNQEAADDPGNEDRAADAADGNDEQEEGFDLIEFAYTVFRFSLVITICLAYSSWERIALVFIIAAFFYWQNAERRYRQLVNVVGQAAALAHAPAAVVNPLAGSGNQLPSSDEGNAIQLGQESLSNTTDISTDSVPSNIIEEPVRGLDRFASVVRFVGITSFQFVCALITSLVPELPVHIE